MGGDHGARVVVPAALQALAKHPELELILVGQEDVIKPLLKSPAAEVAARLRIHAASEVVGMDESPVLALRNKKDSSMRVALNLVKAGEAAACISAGNTGALMATAKYVLKTLPGIDRPAIITALPARTGREVRILDLGANVHCTPENLFQFAVMGTVLTSAIDNIKKPRVGLLNIGEEDIKGNDLVKEAHELISSHPSINYIGFIEANAIFSGNVDVVVCDGFVGNVMLKTVEGVAKFIAHIAKQEFRRNLLTKLSALCAYPVLKRLMKRTDPRTRNGATLIGLNGVVIKSHGSAGVVAFAAAIDEGVMELEQGVAQRIHTMLDKLLQPETGGA